MKIINAILFPVRRTLACLLALALLIPLALIALLDPAIYIAVMHTCSRAFVRFVELTEEAKR